MKFKQYLKEAITYSKIISNTEVLKDKGLTKKLRKLDHQNIQGGFGAVLNYPEENPSKIVIAYDNKEPIGWISFTKGDRGGDQNIFVHTKYRKTGVASKLKDILYSRSSGGYALPEAIYEAKIRLKKIEAGHYDAKIGNIEISLYKGKGYWSSTVTVGKYGDNNWQEQIFQGQTKSEVVRDIETFIRKVS